MALRESTTRGSPLVEYTHEQLQQMVPLPGLKEILQNLERCCLNLPENDPECNIPMITRHLQDINPSIKFENAIRQASQLFILGQGFRQHVPRRGMDRGMLSGLGSHKALASPEVYLPAIKRSFLESKGHQMNEFPQDNRDACNKLGILLSSTTRLLIRKGDSLIPPLPLTNRCGLDDVPCRVPGFLPHSILFLMAIVHSIFDKVESLTYSHAAGNSRLVTDPTSQVTENNSLALANHN
jgi:hypothetical protein